ncbi:MULTISPECIES: hypothetical protein [unclassified Streptomyces]|uniref:hypothetical protein n=1 Tax=unclassified Streptomyces TaxID=2593676 RepID=UPI0004C7180F|nr:MULTISPECIES: hypothetical protein [unclassified Streptomyces]QHF93590.1 hypothetical protein DEH18_06550 [Streptomyces sp. NHF165]
MMMLAELLLELLPSRVRSLRRFVWAAVLLAAVAAIAAYAAGRTFGAGYGDRALWAGVAGGVVLLGYGVAFPFVRERWQRQG